MIDRSEVLHIARLARLSLEETEIEAITAELSSILDHVDQISSLDLEGVEPTAHSVAQSGALRPDVPVESLGKDAVLSQAPATDGSGFEVPSPGGGS
ncbi:MAG: Asp-tRNA(Asn)/Glu-tRNA(Gln) amidotransferase subunit GatC [Solirubrobacterales bacterium]|nr:Asp-tRNA(Asn)/Glu-tRNA(Gln) amidotransferase subunit GatC [Solirubrobacterales bacterium]